MFVFNYFLSRTTFFFIYLILQIERSKDMGPLYTDLGGKHLYGKKGAPPKASFLSALMRSLEQWRQPKKFDG